MSSAQVCPQCGGPIQDTGPGPVCPRCGAAPTLTLPPGDGPPPPTLTLPPGRAAAPPPTLTLPQFLVRLPESAASDAPTATAPPAAAAPPASRVGRFEFREKLGEGAFGEVYRAYDPQLDREVALKVAKPGSLSSTDRVRRFLREAKAAANLRHPHIVPVFEAGQADSRYFLAAAYIPGRTLAAEAADGPADPGRAAAVVRQLAGALGYAHAQGVVHRDVKPSNILVDETGAPHLTDFGLAVRGVGDDRVTHDGAVVGTPAYMAPEQAAGRTEAVGPASDQYALGVILYELLTGRRPFEGPVPVVLTQQVEVEPRRPRAVNPAVPRDLETVALKCLEKDPARRYPSCDALAEDLRRWQAGEPVSARQLTWAGRAAKWARRSPFQAATAAAALGLVVAALLALFARAEAAQADAEIQRRELAERDRRAGVVDRATALYARAEKGADESDRLAPGDPSTGEAWAAVERDANAAHQLLTADPELAGSPLAGPARELRDRAGARRADARARAEARKKLAELAAHHGDAVLFGSGFSYLEGSENPVRAGEAAAAGLKLFGLSADGNGPPVVDARFLTQGEAEVVTDRCHELLLLYAGLLARSPGGAPEDRRRQALTRVDRADRLLGPDRRTRAGLLVRAEILAAAGDTDAAQAAREEAGRTPPRSAADYFLTALDLHRRGDSTAARDPVATILREYPGHAGAEYLLAVFRLQDRQYAAAEDGLTRLLSRRPDLASAQLLRGYVAMELKDWAAARSDFAAVFKSSPDETARYVAQVNLGVVAIRQGAWATAIPALRKATADRPTSPAAYVNLALAIRLRAESTLPESAAVAGAGAAAVPAAGAVREAAGVLDEAVRRCPPEARLHHERGRLRVSLGDYAGGREDFRRAIELGALRGAGGTLADDLAELGQLYHRDRQYREAVRAYEKALALRPNWAAAWRLKSQSHLALNQYPEAGAALDQYLKSAPLTPAEDGLLAGLLRARGRVHDEAARSFRARGLLHDLVADQRRAVEAYSQGLRLGRDPETLALRGWAYLNLNAPGLALEDFEEALRERPGWAEALLGRATLRARAGKVADALADVEEALRQRPAGARPLYMAARVHAMAVEWHFRPGVGRPFNPDAAAAATRRATELLVLALDQPETDKVRFWREYVQADKEFDPVRRSPGMMALEAAVRGDQK